MKLRYIAEDATINAASIIIAALAEFIDEVKRVGFAKWHTGTINASPVPIKWSIAFAGGDIGDVEEFNECLADESFRKFIEAEFPTKMSVFGHSTPSANLVTIRFNPFHLETVTNLDPESLRYNIENTIDHEEQHTRRGDIPSKENPSPMEYYRMPPELDANLQAMAMAYKRRPQQYRSLDDLIGIMTPHAKTAYSTPKWRKLILKGLARRGVIFR